MLASRMDDKDEQEGEKDEEAEESRAVAKKRGPNESGRRKRRRIGDEDDDKKEKRDQKISATDCLENYERGNHHNLADDAFADTQDPYEENDFGVSD